MGGTSPLVQETLCPSGTTCLHCTFSHRAILCIKTCTTLYATRYNFFLKFICWSTKTYSVNGPLRRCGRPPLELLRGSLCHRTQAWTPSHCWATSGQSASKLKRRRKIMQETLHSRYYSIMFRIGTRYCSFATYLCSPS